MKTTKCILCGQEGLKMRGKYCHPCDYKRNKEWFDKRHKARKDSVYYIGKTQYKYYTKARKFYGDICADCGWNKYPEVLQVHHINKNRKDNSIENLVVLCPTCHNTRHFLNHTGLFTPKDFTGDNQQPSMGNDIKVPMKVQRLDSEESTNNLSTSARHSNLSDDIVRAMAITLKETIEAENKESLR